MDRWGPYQVRQEVFMGEEVCILRATAPDASSVVLKMSRQEPCSEALAGRLHHEFAVLQCLAEVPGVIKARGLERRGGHIALILEDAGNRSLKDILSERVRLPLREALQLIRSVSSILESVHRAGLIHKDVKPQNILLDDNLEQIRLLDFGLASRLAFEATVAFIPEAMEGTLAYISPEQTGRTSRTLDARTDLYALGVMLFEMLAGRRPFLETDPLALVYAHLAQLPPALDSLVSEVPSTVARIVERLLAKDPDKRYQTARGLTHDLVRCLEQLARQGKIDSFAIGQNDFSPKLRLPEMLVGREKEVEVVHSAFERVRRGDVEVLLLGGPSGIGKTALVRSVYREMARARQGMLLSGKHDQLARSTPYAALVQAFRGLLQNIASSPRATIHEWKERIDTIVGANARIIADLVPELEWVTGKLAALPELPGDQAYNRLKLAWLSAVQAVLAASAPLVLFLDDLQWIDPGSLELIKMLLTDAERRSILLVAVYRDNEVDASHPLWSLIDAIEKSGAKVSRCTIGPLLVPEIQKWLAGALNSSPDLVEPLANALWSKTRGNPFFLEQLLLDMYRTKKVVRNLDTGEWVWSLAQLETLAVTDNVVELMRTKLRELPDETQNLLGLAACSGHTFTLDDLTTLSGWIAQSVTQALWPALLEGMVTAVDLQSRYAQALAEENRLQGQMQGRYQFLHDRVQQACYEGISESERNRAHLDIGRKLRSRYESQGGTAQELLALVRHLNLGGTYIESPDELLALAQLNLDGARKAKASGAYRLMAELLEQGMRILGAEPWETSPALASQLAVERVEAAYLLRAFGEVEELTRPLLQRDLPPIVHWMLQELRLRTCLSCGRFASGAALGKEIFGDSDRKLPDTEQAQFAEAIPMLHECRAWRFRIGDSGLAAIPLDPDPLRTIKDAAIFPWIFSLAASGHLVASAWVISWRLKELMEKGKKTLFSPLILAYLATAWGPLFDEPREAAQWTSDALLLLRGIDSPAVSFVEIMGACVLAYHQPAREALPLFEKVIHTGLAQGNFQVLSGGCYGVIRDGLLWPGTPLTTVQIELEKKMLLVRRAGDAIGQNSMDLFASVLECLLKDAQPVCDEAGEILSLGSKGLISRGDALNAVLAEIFETQIFLMTRQLNRAFDRARRADQNRLLMSNVPMGTDIPLYLGLTASGLIDGGTPAPERAALLQHLDKAIERFRYLCAGCSENFLHKLRLLEAEQARLAGRGDEATAKYDEAIELARQQGYLHIEALSAQLSGEFHHKAGRRRFASLYFQEARDAYQRWDALAMVRFMNEQYPDFFREPPRVLAAATIAPDSSAIAQAASSTGTTTHSVRSTRSGTLQLDAETAILASQALASELNPARIVSKLMQLLIENAGAQRGVLLLGHEDALVVTARLDAHKSLIETDLQISLSACAEVAHGMVDTVARTRQFLVLPDAPADPRFSNEPRLALSRTHAVLVAPLMHQTRLVGVLYLEHDERNAFTIQCVNLLGVLAAQTAIALENARLYEELQRSNTGLESQVAARTAELQATLAELWSEMDLATKIQTVLLPSDGVYGGHQIAATMRPADKVGGDYYDMFEHAGATWVLVGDVSGHGVSAGLIMMMVQSAIRTLVCAKPDEIPSPAEVLTQVNSGIANNLQKIGRGQYMTVIAMCLEGRKARFAGMHLDLLIYRNATQIVEPVTMEGVYLGMIEDATGLFTDQSLALEPGDILLFHTDGLPEARRGDLFLGLAELQAKLEEKGKARATPREITDAAFELLKGARCDDDVTVLTLRIG